MGATERNPGGGVVGFAIAFLAFAFGSALGLPESVRLVVIGVGVLVAVVSARMRGIGLAALVLGGVVLIQSIVLFGALGASRDPAAATTAPPQATPPIATVDETSEPQDGAYILTPNDKQIIEASWARQSEAEQRAICASIRDGISDAELEASLRGLREAARLGLAEGTPEEVLTDETGALAYLRAGYAYTETELC